jgi:DNA-binding Lrp family transcriptional regulator
MDVPLVCNWLLPKTHLAQNVCMDTKDRTILALLQHDADMPLADIAARVHLSPTPCWRRIQKLRESGVIRKQVALCDAQRLNVGVTVFVAVRTREHTQAWLDRFSQGVKDIPEVVELAGLPTSDGAGVKLTRVLTQDLQRRLDPFLMLDAFGSDDRDDYIGGFPDHPHRGFETITYMIAGRMRHRDSAGHEGLLSRRRAVDDRRPRRHPQRDARAGGRPDGRLPALAEPAGARQDAHALVPRHPQRARCPVTTPTAWP